MKRLLIVYSREASRYERIETEVLAQARKMKGFLLGKFEIKRGMVGENAARLAKLLKDGDLVVAVGGDGTVAVAVDGIMRSGKKVLFGALGYGEFNDVAGLLGMDNLKEIVDFAQAGKTTMMYPLEVKINGQRWRYALGYMTMGMAAEATKMLADGLMRKKLQQGRCPKWRVYLWMARWYYANRMREFVPELEMLERAPEEKLEPGKGVMEPGMEMEKSEPGAEKAEPGAEKSEPGAEKRRVRQLKGATDIIILNVPKMAGVLKGENWQEKPEVFGVGAYKLKWSGPLFKFMMQSMFKKVPVKEVAELVLRTRQPVQLGMQTEGEYEWLEGVQEIRVQKGAPLLVVAKN